MSVVAGLWRSRMMAVAAAVGMIAGLMALAAAGSMAWAAADGASARHLVEQVTSSIVDELTSHREAHGDDPQAADDPQAIYEFVDRLVLPYFDFERMARRVLGKRWKSATPEQHARFVSAFRALLVQTYSKVVSEYQGQTLTYLDPVPRKKEGEFVVPMLIELADGSSFRIAYAMHGDGSDWKVFDVAVDGVSLVTNYRSSFRSEIARHGIDGLIERLEAKNSPAD